MFLALVAASVLVVSGQLVVAQRRSGRVEGTFVDYLNQDLNQHINFYSGDFNLSLFSNA